MLVVSTGGSASAIGSSSGTGGASCGASGCGSGSGSACGAACCGRGAAGAAAKVGLKLDAPGLKEKVGALAFRPELLGCSAVCVWAGPRLVSAASSQSSILIQQGDAGHSGTLQRPALGSKADLSRNFARLPEVARHQFQSGFAAVKQQYLIHCKSSVLRMHHR